MNLYPTAFLALKQRVGLLKVSKWRFEIIALKAYKSEKEEEEKTKKKRSVQERKT